MKETTVPEPTCLNTNRPTLKCRKKCCRKVPDPIPESNSVQYSFNIVGGIGNYCDRCGRDITADWTRHDCAKCKSL